MRQLSVVCMLVGILCSAMPAHAQMGESRWVLRATALSLNSETGEFLETGSSLETSTVKPTLGVEYQYMVGDPWAVCTSFTLSPFGLYGTGGDIGTARAADMWFLPATLTIRYELQLFGPWEPYFGAGVNVSFFWARDVGTQLQELGVEDLTAKPHFRYALEAGVNYQLDQKRFATFDVKYLETSTTLDFEAADSSDLDRVDFEGSPWEIGLGIGWRF